MRHRALWQDRANVLLGLWLMVVPVIWHFSGNTAAAVNAVVVGSTLAATVSGAIPWPHAWTELGRAWLGLWLMVSPWVLEFSTLVPARDVTLASGAAILALAAWILATDKAFSAWIHQRGAP